MSRIMRPKLDMVCELCGKEYKDFYSNVARHKKHYCSRECGFEGQKLNNTTESWRGGRISKSTGYKYIKIDGKDREEHRLVMERHLGRRLETWEHVHHINGDKLDNRLENLEVVTKWEHRSRHKTGRDRKCLICGEVKEHHARGLCHSCYRSALRKGRINEYEKVSS